VSTAWLDKELKAKKDNLAVLDATWFPDKNASEAFSK